MVFPIHLVVNHSANGHHAGGESFPTPSAAWVHIPVLSTNPWVEYKSLGWVQILGSSTNPCAEYKSLGWAQILGLSTNPWVEYKSLGWVQILVLFLSSIGLILWIKCAVSCAFSGYFILLASIHAVWIAPIFSPVQPTRPTEPGDTSCRPVKNRRREMVLPRRGCQKNDQQKINRWLCWISSFEKLTSHVYCSQNVSFKYFSSVLWCSHCCALPVFFPFWQSPSAILSSAILFINEQNVSYSRPSHILTVTWLDFHREVLFYKIQKSEWAGWRHCRSRVTCLDFHCEVLFCTIQKSEWAWWRHCRSRVTWLDFHREVLFCTIQKSEWAGWRHCRSRVMWLLKHEVLLLMFFRSGRMTMSMFSLAYPNKSIQQKPTACFSVA